MDKFEQFIQNKKEALEERQLPLEHQSRFEKKLDAMTSGNNFQNAGLMRYAAVIAIFLVLSIGGMALLFSEQKNAHENIYAETMPELYETELYYLAMFETKKAQVHELITQEQIDELNKDLEEFDALIVGLKEDLQMTHGDQRVADAIINCYLKKIEMMDYLIVNAQKFI